MEDQKTPTYGNGKICYIDIPALDIAVSVEFYSNVFGWETRARGDGSVAFDDGVGQVSGTWSVGRSPAATPGFVISIMVDSAEETIRKIQENGCEIVQEIGAEAPEITAHFRDPAGNILGIYQHRGSAG